jgi:hypothetical protein
MDEELIKSLEIKAEQLKKRLDHLRIERVNKRLNFRQWREFFTTKEKLHAIYLKLQNPNDLVVYDIKVQGFKISQKTNVKALTEALDARGIKWSIDYKKRTVSFYWRRSGQTFPLRTYDVAVVKGTSSNAIMEPAELKTPSALLNSIKGKLHEGPIEGELKTRSGKTKLVGGQIETEKWLKKLASEHKIEAVLLESQNIENDFPVKHDIKPDNLKLSRATKYEASSSTMFSSLRTKAHRIQRNLARARQRQARERAKSRLAEDPRGVSDNGKENKSAEEPGPSPKERQIQRNPERAGQRQAGERAKSRLAEDPRGVSNNGKVNRLAEESSPKPSVVVRGSKIAGRLLKKGVGLALAAALTILDVKQRAKKAVSQLPQDLANRLTEVGQEIENQKLRQLKKVENLRLFEAAPFDQFWFRIEFVLQLEITYDKNDPVFRYTHIEVKDISIVKSPAKGGFDHNPKPTEIDRISEQEYVEYHPVFEELTRGQKLAADGYPLRVIDGSHDGPTGKQRTQIIYDYITFAKEYPQLTNQYNKAWQKYKFELCVAGYTDLFTPQQIENCKDEKLLYQLPGDKSETDDWRLRPIEIDRGTLNKYLNRRP